MSRTRAGALRLGLLSLRTWMLGFLSFQAWVLCEAQAPTVDQLSPLAVQPLSGPWVVALQPGHWLSSELPDELSRLRPNYGTAAGAVREVDINRRVTALLAERLRALGWTVLVVPATVPPGLRADAFLSIHADGSSDPSRQGWKLAAPWRSNAAGLALADSLRQAFLQTDLVHDEDGITINMRGYFGFSYRRFMHAVSPNTPSVLVELGFVSHAGDRRRLTTEPDRYATLLVQGLQQYFVNRPRSRVDDLVPPVFPRLVVGPAGSSVLSQPQAGAAVRAWAAAGIAINPVGEQGEWYEVSLRTPRVIGWVSKATLLGHEGPRFPPRF